MFGRMYGIKFTSFIYKLLRSVAVGEVKIESPTSSTRDGSSFLCFRPSEKPLRTEVSPFMKATFSSLGLVEKVDRSRKLSVDTGREEKKDAAGIAETDRRLWRLRVIKFRKSAETKVVRLVTSDFEYPHCNSWSKPFRLGIGFPALSRRFCRLP